MRQAMTCTFFCFLCFAAAFHVGALVIVVPSVVRCVLVWRVANEEKWGRGGWGGIIKSWGVAFELFEVAVVCIGILFASIRHERD